MGPVKVENNFAAGEAELRVFGFWGLGIGVVLTKS
jgi:hypothetical protein